MGFESDDFKLGWYKMSSLNDFNSAFDKDPELKQLKRTKENDEKMKPDKEMKPDEEMKPTEEVTLEEEDE